jgi:hypothetical protein
MNILKYCPMHFGEFGSIRTIRCIEMKLNCIACAELYAYMKGYTSIGHIPRNPMQTIIAHCRHRIDRG